MCSSPQLFQKRSPGVCRVGGRQRQTLAHLGLIIPVVVTGWGSRMAVTSHEDLFRRRISAEKAGADFLERAALLDLSLESS